MKLDCCGYEHDLDVNDTAIERGELDEVRKNVVCPVCDKLVILHFHPPFVEQEVV